MFVASSLSSPNTAMHFAPPAELRSEEDCRQSAETLQHCRLGEDGDMRRKGNIAVEPTKISNISRELQTN